MLSQVPDASAHHRCWQVPGQVGLVMIQNSACQVARLGERAELSVLYRSIVNIANKCQTIYPRWLDAVECSHKILAPCGATVGNPRYRRSPQRAVVSFVVTVGRDQSGA